MDYKQKVGYRIRAARKEKGWKLRELAEKTDNLVSVSRLNNYEHGTRMPGPAEAVILAKALGARPAYLMGLDDIQLQIRDAQEEALVKNWRKLPENERMHVLRQVEQLSIAYRDTLQTSADRRVAPTSKRAPLTSSKQGKGK